MVKKRFPVFVPVIWNGGALRRMKSGMTASVLTRRYARVVREQVMFLKISIPTPDNF